MARPTSVHTQNSCVAESCDKEIVDYVSHPTEFCLDKGYLCDDNIPRWTFNVNPPDGSPLLVLVREKKAIGIWSLRFRRPYLFHLGFLIFSRHNFLVADNQGFPKGGPDIHFYRQRDGLHLEVSFRFNSWEKPKNCAGACHIDLP